MRETPARSRRDTARLTTILAGATLVLALGIALAPQVAAEPALEPAPPYAATSLDGTPVTLEGMRGQVVVLNIWATWCTACLEEMPRLQELQDAYADRGVVVIGSSVDAEREEGNVRAMADSLGVRYPIWLDPEDRATSTFRLIGLPATFVITADGDVAHVWRGQFDPLSNDTHAIVLGALEGRAVLVDSGVSGLGLVVAFAAGALSFLSPCVFPLLPSYVGVVSGLSLDELTKGDDADRARVRRRILANGLIFVAGFTTVFLALGASATLLGSTLREHRGWLVGGGGVLLIVFGLSLLGVLRIPGADRDIRFRVQSPGARKLGVFAIGLAFGAGWTPCIGPVLAGILTLAASTASLAQGLWLLLAYSLGLALPFLAAALALRRIMPRMSRWGRWLPRLHKASGVLLIAMGVLLLTGGLTLLTAWAARWTPTALRGIG